MFGFTLIQKLSLISTWLMVVNSAKITLIEDIQFMKSIVLCRTFLKMELTLFISSMFIAIWLVGSNCWKLLGDRNGSEVIVLIFLSYFSILTKESDSSSREFTTTWLNLFQTKSTIVLQLLITWCIFLFSVLLSSSISLLFRWDLH